MFNNTNPIDALLAILGWGLVAVVAIGVVAVIVALLRGLYGVFTSPIRKDDDNGRN